MEGLELVSKRDLCILANVHCCPLYCNSFALLRTQKIREALMASLQVLSKGRAQPFTQRELLRAKRTLLTRHESDLKVGGRAL